VIDELFDVLNQVIFNLTAAELISL